jgi:hypothetical protein
MSTEPPQDRPNGDRVNVIDTVTAAYNLPRMLQRFRAGQAEPLIFGDDGQPGGVVVPFDRWEELEELAEDAEQAAEIRNVTQQRLATNRSEDYVSTDAPRRRVPREPRQRQRAAHIPMTAKYHLILDPGLGDELRELHARAKQFEVFRVALSALRTGREAEVAGERLGRSDNHPDLRDCAEIKIPVVEEFNRRSQPLGPSTESPYRERSKAAPNRLCRCDKSSRSHPRKDGEIFDVTANRLGHSKGIALDELDRLPTVHPATDLDRPTTPPRMARPPGLAQSFKP